MVARWRWVDEATSCGSASNLRQTSRSARWREFGTTLTAVRSACLAGDQQSTLGSSGFRSLGRENLANGLRNHARFETPIRSEFKALVKGDEGLIVYTPGGQTAPSGTSGRAFGALGFDPESGVRIGTPRIPGSGTPNSLALGLSSGSQLKGRSYRGPDANAVSIHRSTNVTIISTRLPSIQSQLAPGFMP